MDDLIRIPLTETERLYLSRPVEGNGGFQRLLKRLKAGLSGNVLTLTPADADELVRAGSRYGQGGFQDRIKRLVPLAQEQLIAVLQQRKRGAGEGTIPGP